MSEFENKTPNIVVLYKPESPHVIGEVFVGGGVVIEAETEVDICNSKSPGFCRTCEYRYDCPITNKFKSP